MTNSTDSEVYMLLVWISELPRRWYTTSYSFIIFCLSILNRSSLCMYLEERKKDKLKNSYPLLFVYIWSDIHSGRMASPKLFGFFIIHLLVLFVSNPCVVMSLNSSTLCIKEERVALLKFKNYLKEPENRLSSWVGKDCCNGKV